MIDINCISCILCFWRRKVEKNEREMNTRQKTTLLIIILTLLFMFNVEKEEISMYKTCIRACSSHSPYRDLYF